MAFVVADDEEDLAFTAGVLADELGDVEPGDRGGGNFPGGGDAPVAAVDEPGGFLVEASGCDCGSVALGLIPASIIRAPSPP